MDDNENPRDGAEEQGQERLMGASHEGAGGDDQVRLRVERVFPISLALAVAHLQARLGEHLLELVAVELSIAG